MKQLLSILLALLILVLATKDIATYAAFKINQEFIANNWCVNINNPEANCSGKCYLNKEIKDSKEDNKDQRSLPISEEFHKNYYNAGTSFELTEKEADLGFNNFVYLAPKPLLMTYDFLDPPQDLI